MEAGDECLLQSYQAMKKVNALNDRAETIILRLAQGNWERVVSQFVGGVGVSQSWSLEEDNFLAL
jgi:hypothetical protein